MRWLTPDKVAAGITSLAVPFLVSQKNSLEVSMVLCAPLALLLGTRRFCAVPVGGRGDGGSMAKAEEEESPAMDDMLKWVELSIYRS